MRANMENVKDGYVVNKDGTPTRIFVDTVAWFEWLEHVDMFYYEEITDTIRIKLVVRHDDPKLGIVGWRAYGQPGRVPGFHLGNAAKDISFDKLKLAAQIMGEASDEF